MTVVARIMKPALLAWALSALTLASAKDFEPARAELLDEDGPQGDTPADTLEAVEYTVFNGIQVPPMKDIKGDEFGETIKDGYWYVLSFRLRTRLLTI